VFIYVDRSGGIYEAIECVNRRTNRVMKGHVGEGFEGLEDGRWLLA
jgi:hypothetical protein